MFSSGRLGIQGLESGIENMRHLPTVLNCILNFGVGEPWLIVFRMCRIHDGAEAELAETRSVHGLYCMIEVYSVLGRSNYKARSSHYIKLGLE